MTKTSTNPFHFDVRVRERFIRAGELSEKDVEKYVAQLPDLADLADPVGTPQPALKQPEMIAADLDDEDEVDEPEAMEAAPAPAPVPAPVAVAAPAPAPEAPVAAPVHEEPAAEPAVPVDGAPVPEPQP